MAAKDHARSPGRGHVWALNGRIPYFETLRRVNAECRLCVTAEVVCIGRINIFEGILPPNILFTLRTRWTAVYGRVSPVPDPTALRTSHMPARRVHG